MPYMGRMNHDAPGSAELRKVWRSRFFLVALAALLGANLFLLWVGTKPASSAFTPAAYHALCADIKGMDMPQMGEFLHESLRRAEAMSRIENVLRTEAWNGGTQDEYMRAQYAQEFSEFTRNMRRAIICAMAIPCRANTRF